MKRTLTSFEVASILAITRCVFPGFGLVVEAVISADVLAVPFIVPFGATQRLVDIFHKGRIAGKAGGEAHVKMSLCPFHELMAAEVAVAAKLDHRMPPCLVQILDHAAQYSEDIQRLVAPSQPEQRENELAVHAVENHQLHIAVFIVIVIEQ